MSLLVLLAGIPGPLAAGDEIVFADFDLSGWQRAGACSLTTPPLTDGSLSDLIDADAGTSARAVSPGTISIDITFRKPQIVRRVVLRPGSARAHAVRLTVVEADGSRFAAGELVVQGQRAIFRLADVAVRSLALEVDPLESGAIAHVAGLAVSGRMTISSVYLVDVPPTLPEGGSFPVRVLGIDSLGGHPDLTTRSQLAVTPARSLALTRGGRALTRVGGALTVAPRLESLRGPPVPLSVLPLDPAPPVPDAQTGHAVVLLTLAGDGTHEVLRRTEGRRDAEPLGIARTRWFHDNAVEPGTAYHYTVRRVDNLGNPLTKVSREQRVRTWPTRPGNVTDIGRLPVLVALFTDSFAPGEADEVVASLRAAAAFWYRHTQGRVLPDLVVLPVPGPTPPTQGPTMAGIESRLRDLGVADDTYGMVYATAADLPGAYAGFRLLGSTAGTMGHSQPMPAPPGALGPRPDVAWVFAHELFHAVELVMAPAAGRDNLPSHHFAEDFASGRLGSDVGRPLDAADGWSGLATLLASFDGWDALVAPHRRVLEVLDTDDDGLADDDARLPYDERRLGTDPTQPDSDGDGLGDMAELAAGLYAGSDPLTADTDDDGRPDGSDPWPLIALAPAIPTGHEPVTMMAGAVHTAAGFDPGPVQLALAWSTDGLHLRLATAIPTDVLLDLDGSGALGRWETDAACAPVGDTNGDTGSDVWCGEARVVLRTAGSSPSVFIGRRHLDTAQLVTATNAEGQVVLTVSLPAALGPGATDVHTLRDAEHTPGLRLRAGTVLGLAVTLVPPGTANPSDPFGASGWASLFEPHALLDLPLAAKDGQDG